MGPSSIDIQVRFSELDPYGHLNHAVYATYFEAARVEALEAVDLGLIELADQGYQVVVTSVTFTYKKPALAHDRVTITTEVTETRRASSVWHQEMHRDGELLATADVAAAITDTAGKPTRPPEWLWERLSPLVTASAD